MLFSEMLDRGQDCATAIVDVRRPVTYDEFRSAVAGFAAHLHGMGLAKGDRVALWGYNSANWLVAFYAIVRAGGVALLVNYSMNVGDAAELLTSAAPQAAPYDFVFIDAAKGQYLDYLRKVEPLLADEAVILADNVLFRGYVRSAEKPPRRFRTIVKRLREYIRVVTETPGYATEILENGDGLAVTRYQRLQKID